MKILQELNPADIEKAASNFFTLPQGLIGFPAFTRAELVYLPNQLPFTWLKLHSPTDCIYFIVIEPAGVVPDYNPELFDRDAAALDLQNASEALVLNIVSLKDHDPMDATVNLVGPIIVNRRTRVGRQLVVANYTSYSACYQLLEARTVAACA
jgi:flagellar assembly factor FliW